MNLDIFSFFQKSKKKKERRRKHDKRKKEAYPKTRVFPKRREGGRSKRVSIDSRCDPSRDVFIGRIDERSFVPPFEAFDKQRTPPPTSFYRPTSAVFTWMRKLPPPSNINSPPRRKGKTRAWTLMKLEKISAFLSRLTFRAERNEFSIRVPVRDPSFSSASFSFFERFLFSSSFFFFHWVQSKVLLKFFSKLSSHTFLVRDLVCTIYEHINISWF